MSRIAQAAAAAHHSAAANLGFAATPHTNFQPPPAATVVPVFDDSADMYAEKEQE